MLAVARERAPALVHFDDPGAARTGPVPGTLGAFAPHNVEHEIQSAVAGSSTGVRRRFAALEARRVLAEERAAWRWADLCVAVSDADAAAMVEGGARRVVVAPNGTDPVDRRPLRRRDAETALRLLFVGSAYLPNVLGVRWLADEVLPLLRGRLPVVVDVVGLAPELVPAAPELRAHGRVPSVGPHYARADVVVVPLHHGSGTRLKVVEALAHGVPVVSTRLGAAGLGLTPGQSYLAADTAPAFAGALTALAADLVARPAHVEAMLDAGRAAAEALFWPRIADRLADAYEELAAGGPHGRGRHAGATGRPPRAHDSATSASSSHPPAPR